ncbi:Beta-lactamase domain-containing protein 2 [Holothuria leucospilota]|uniref:Beta-lactamase domain-containing protein 2 n=1 Tax=Holothuria leucospilota TaxID=206669 RepID=A0A9Q1C3Y6_HOLLE|nr:Beta-lactamase domain-containing protein 2 [Holothuria leucospilota]
MYSTSKGILLGSIPRFRLVFQKGNQLQIHAALPYFPEAMTFDMLRDPSAMDKVIENAKPLWEPGTGHGYHAITFGFLVNGLVRRVDPEKRTVGQFLNDEVAEPFDIDIFIGTPPIESLRVSRTVIVDVYFLDKVYAFATSWLYRQVLSAFTFQTPAGKMATKMFGSCGEICEIERQDDPEIRQLEMPAVNGVATARAIAKTFGILANGGKLGNKTLLSEKMIDAYSFDRRGETPDLCLFDFNIRWKYGMHLIPQGENEMNLFGSPGAGGQLGYADPNRNIGYGYVTRYISPEGWAFMDPRLRRLQESTLNAIKRMQT